MTNPLTRGMSKVTDLTKAGKLTEATALIQSLLRKTPETAPGAETEQAIEGTFQRLDPTDPPAAAPTGQTPKAARQPLSETLRKIAAGGMPKRGPLANDTVALPKGAQFLSLTHSSPEGSRSYRLYIPEHRSALPMPLIVMLHGCTQSPEDFAIGTGMNLLAEEFGCIVAYPAQPSGANMQKCWNWFRAEDQQRDKGEPALLAGLTRDILRDFPVDPTRVYVAGLSAGGAAAAILAQAYPDLFSAVGVHSGLPVGSATDIPSAFSAMRSGAKGRALKAAVPTIAFHGLADSTVHPSNGNAVLDQSLKRHPGLARSTAKGVSKGNRAYRQTRHAHPDGRTLAEHWEIEGAGHAWAGGDAKGSYTDPDGPDASREMLRFFLQHSRS